MNKRLSERIHRYLDGDLRREDLTPGEIEEVAAHEALFGELRALDRSITVPDIARRVMSRLPETTNRVAGDRGGGIDAGSFYTLVRGAFGWLWSPRPVPFRPAYAIAAAVVVFLAIFAGGENRLQETAETGNGNAGSRIFVQFRIDAPEASSVRLAGSFTGWQATYTLHETASGVWSVLVPLQPGVHDYAFVVNGNWVNDPVAPVVDDGFGGVNSRLMVVLPDGASQL